MPPQKNTSDLPRQPPSPHHLNWTVFNSERHSCGETKCFQLRFISWPGRRNPVPGQLIYLLITVWHRARWLRLRNRPLLYCGLCAANLQLAQFTVAAVRLLYLASQRSRLNCKKKNLQIFSTRLVCCDTEANELGECASVLRAPQLVSYCQWINVQLLAENVTTGQGPPPEPCGACSMAPVCVCWWGLMRALLVLWVSGRALTIIGCCVAMWNETATGEEGKKIKRLSLKSFSYSASSR